MLTRVIVRLSGLKMFTRRTLHLINPGVTHIAHLNSKSRGTLLILVDKPADKLPRSNLRSCPNVFSVDRMPDRLKVNPKLKMKTVRTSLLNGTHSITKKSPGNGKITEFSVIVSELKKLEHDFSSDVAVLREQIELASLDFTEAQKRFDKLEKEYISAKLELFVKKERKDQLTNHLVTVIKQNEIEKAKTISGFVGKLELAPCPMEKHITEQGNLCEKQPQEQEQEKGSAENMTEQKNVN